MWGPAFSIVSSAYDPVRKLFYAFSDDYSLYTLDTSTMPPSPQNMVPINDDPVSMGANSKTGELWGIFMSSAATTAVGRINLKTGAVTYDIPFNDTLSYISDGATVDDL